VLVEFDQTCDVLHELRGQFLYTKHTGSHRRCDGRLKVRGSVSLPDLPRNVLMESMHKIVEFERIDFSTFPTPPFPFILTETGIFTGGTGKYSGATGTFTFKVHGAFLSFDATGQRGFAWFKDTAVMAVTVP
jgi:hypothetical protein